MRLLLACAAAVAAVAFAAPSFAQETAPAAAPTTTPAKLKAGTTYTPYKKSTDCMNPFSGMLGDYAVVMGNTGGDNRVEFGTRIDHSLWYESPKFGGMFSFDVLFSPGQNRTPDSLAQSSGSSDCNGGN